MRIHKRAIVGLLGAFALLWLSPHPADAHQTSLNVSLVPIDGSVSPIKFGSKSAIRLGLSSGNGGKIKFKVKKTVDAAGDKITALGNKLVIDATLNGAPQTWEFSFDILNGNGKLPKTLLGLVAPDLIQFLEIRAEDSSGVAFARSGFIAGKGPTKGVSSAMVQVDEGSPILLATDRDSEVIIRTKHGGDFHISLDKVHDAGGNPITSFDNTIELEVVINGGAPTVLSYHPYDIIDDRGDLDVNLGLSDGDVVEVRRVDIFDPSGDRFATFGVKIRSPKF